MTSESFDNSALPEEININLKLQVGEDGKSFLYEKDGMKYGGDFQDETPAEIFSEDDVVLPPPPEEKNFVL